MDVRPPTPPPAGAGRRVLIVEDDEGIRHALRRYFTRQGWAVDEAVEGQGALTLLFAEGAAHYDVIISDLRMPGMSGMALYDQLAARRPALAGRMVVTTGDTFTDGARAFLARTGCEVLAKPFELAELRAVVERVAGRP